MVSIPGLSLWKQRLREEHFLRGIRPASAAGYPLYPNTTPHGHLGEMGKLRLTEKNLPRKEKQQPPGVHFELGVVTGTFTQSSQ